MRASLGVIEGVKFDVVVVGAGINGASTALYLARAGYRTLLLEKSDFGSGASSRSSRLIHNGLAYLAGRARSFRDLVMRPPTMVSNLLAARQCLLNQVELWRTHPRRMHRQTFLLPHGRGNPFTMWQTILGLSALNVSVLNRGSVPFWRVRNPGDYTLYQYFQGSGRPTEVLAFDDVVADAPERLCVDLALAAVAAGATVANYARVADIHRAASLWRVGIEDRLYRRAVEVESSLVVNTAGPWSAEVDRMGSSAPLRRMETVKGTHIMVRTAEHQPEVALLTFAGGPNRASRDRLFAIPFRGMYMMGNTHTLYRDPLDQVSATRQEVDYLLETAQSAFPGAELGEKNLVYAFSGVRPMSVVRGAIELRPLVHDLEEEEGLSGRITVTGAPITDCFWTARRVLSLARKKMLSLGPCAGGPGPTLQQGSDPSPARQPAADPICPHGAATFRDAAYAFATEDATSLSDVLFRRVLHVWNECLGLHCARRVAETLAPMAGWDATRVDQEVTAYRQQVSANFFLAHSPVDDDQA